MPLSARPLAPHCDSPTPCPEPLPVRVSRPPSTLSLTLDDLAPSERTKPPALAPANVWLPFSPLKLSWMTRPEMLAWLTETLLSAPTRTP